MIDQFRRMVEPIQRRVMMAIGRAVLNAVYDGSKAQLVQASMLGDEVRDKMERMAEYGFTSNPKPGAQGVAVFVGGERGHGVMIATCDYTCRLPNLASGEVALYTDEGDKIVLKRGKLIEITTDTLVVKAGTKVRFETPLVEGTGDIIDNAGSNARTMKGMRDRYNVHTHPGDSGGTTGTPNQGM
ncbi:MAG: phage baseplate assembly protein V [Novosphingobium sp.]